MNIAIKQVTQIFWFPYAYKSYVAIALSLKNVCTLIKKKLIKMLTIIWLIIMKKAEKLQELSKCDTNRKWANGVGKLAPQKVCLTQDCHKSSIC